MRGFAREATRGADAANERISQTSSGRDDREDRSGRRARARREVRDVSHAQLVSAVRFLRATSSRLKLASPDSCFRPRGRARHRRSILSGTLALIDGGVWIGFRIAGSRTAGRRHRFFPQSGQPADAASPQRPTRRASESTRPRAHADDHRFNRGSAYRRRTRARPFGDAHEQETRNETRCSPSEVSSRCGRPPRGRRALAARSARPPRPPAPFPAVART